MKEAEHLGMASVLQMVFDATNGTLEVSWVEDFNQSSTRLIASSGVLDATVWPEGMKRIEDLGAEAIEALVRHIRWNGAQDDLTPDGVDEEPGD